MGHLRVAACKPTAKGENHWCIQLEDDEGDSYIFQVVGEHIGEYERDVRQANPSESKEFIKYVEACEIDGKSAFEEAKDILENLPINKENTGWCCQDFVLEGLESLHDADLIEDNDYETAKDALLAIYNE